MDWEMELSWGPFRELMRSQAPTVSPTAIRPEPARMSAVGFKADGVAVARCCGGGLDDAGFSRAATGIGSGSRAVGILGSSSKSGCADGRAVSMVEEEASSVRGLS